MQNIFNKIKQKLEERATVYRKEEEYMQSDPHYQRGLYGFKATGYEDALRIVKEAEEEYNNGWISCSERLPESGDDDIYPMCIVTLDNGDVCLGVYREYDEEWWTRMSEGETVYSNNHKVLAWQPLPASYKEVGEVNAKSNT